MNGRKAPERGGRVGPEHLSPLRGWLVSVPIPTACAVGYILPLLRSWFRSTVLTLIRPHAAATSAFIPAAHNIVSVALS